jgi:hypothetical protein
MTNNLVIFPHPPYLPDLAPCDFAFFPKLKMKLQGRYFKAVSDIKREMQAVLDSIKEMTSTVLSKHGKNYGFTVCVPKETILKEIAAKIE